MHEEMGRLLQIQHFVLAAFLKLAPFFSFCIILTKTFIFDCACVTILFGEMLMTASARHFLLYIPRQHSHPETPRWTNHFTFIKTLTVDRVKFIATIQSLPLFSANSKCWR